MQTSTPFASSAIPEFIQNASGLSSKVMGPLKEEDDGIYLWYIHFKNKALEVIFYTMCLLLLVHHHLFP